MFDHVVRNGSEPYLPPSLQCSLKHNVALCRCGSSRITQFSAAGSLQPGPVLKPNCQYRQWCTNSFQQRVRSNPRWLQHLHTSQDQLHNRGAGVLNWGRCTSSCPSVGRVWVGLYQHSLIQVGLNQTNLKWWVQLC